MNMRMIVFFLLRKLSMKECNFLDVQPTFITVLIRN